ncbi:hypothetical protein BRD00_13315 [Halobacteriales archaeon QS_8_69_26]|nr:MAG: hypothetical protein BRD00_13315 [Halobacteriales archaeon QS_8_69_26]
MESPRFDPDVRNDPLLQGLLAFAILLSVPVALVLLWRYVPSTMPGIYLGLGGGLAVAPLGYLLAGGLAGYFTDGPVVVVLPALGVATGAHALSLARGAGVNPGEVFDGTLAGQVVLVGWSIAVAAGFLGILSGTTLRSWTQSDGEDGEEFPGGE